MKTTQPNVSNAACTARKNLRDANALVIATVGNIQEHEIARQLREEALDQVNEIDPGFWHSDFEEAFWSDVRTAVRLNERGKYGWA